MTRLVRGHVGELAHRRETALAERIRGSGSVTPPTMSSIGGGTTDVKMAPGDVFALRFRYFPVPDSQGSLDGVQAYLEKRSTKLGAPRRFPRG